jgi:hypothetical protein
MLTHRTSYGGADTREGAMAAFKAEYEILAIEMTDACKTEISG